MGCSGVWCVVDPLFNACGAFVKEIPNSRQTPTQLLCHTIFTSFPPIIISLFHGLEVRESNEVI